MGRVAMVFSKVFVILVGVLLAAGDNCGYGDADADSRPEHGSAMVQMGAVTHQLPEQETLETQIEKAGEDSQMLAAQNAWLEARLESCRVGCPECEVCETCGSGLVQMADQKDKAPIEPEDDYMTRKEMQETLAEATAANEELTTRNAELVDQLRKEDCFRECDQCEACGQCPPPVRASPPVRRRRRAAEFPDPLANWAERAEGRIHQKICGPRSARVSCFYYYRDPDDGSGYWIYANRATWADGVFTCPGVPDTRWQREMVDRRMSMTIQQGRQTRTEEVWFTLEDALERDASVCR